MPSSKSRSRSRPRSRSRRQTSRTQSRSRFEFRRSTRPFKKYMVHVGNKWVHFGDTRYQQYRDRTPLRLYARLNHGDPARRRNYKARHGGTRHVKYSASWFADKYLW